MRDLRVLIVSATNLRRGAELQSMGLASALHAEGLFVRHLAVVDVRDGHDKLPIEGLGKHWWSASVLLKLRRACRGVDVVIAFGSTSLPACVASGIRLKVPILYRSIGDPEKWVRGNLHRWRTGFLMRRTSHVCALWEQAATSFSRLYRIPLNRTSVIPNARSSTQFRPCSIEERQLERRKLGVDSQTKLIAVISALAEEKQIDRAIRSISGDNDLQMIVAGDGPVRSDLERLADQVAPGRVKFLGPIADIERIYWAADLVLISSRTEGMPGSAIEAGLSGVAVVSTDVGGVRDVVRDGETGIVVGGDDPSDIYSAIIRAYEVSELLGRSAASHCNRNFTWAAVAPLWVRLIDELVEGRGLITR